MDMENEMLKEGTAGEVGTPESEDENRAPAAEAEGEKEGGDAEHHEESGKQTHAERVRYSAARRQGEKTGYERAGKEFNARIAGAGLVDPITNKPITTLEEFEDYGKRFRQQRLEAKAKAENKTVFQVEEEETAMEYLKQKRREDDEKARRSKEEQTQREWMQQDARDFAEAFPGVDLGALESDPKFRKFCGGRLYKVPAAELYADYLEVVGEAAKSARVKQADKEDRGTGAGGGAGSKVMTARQREELEAWNRAYPEMKMTEKEFRQWNRK